MLTSGISATAKQREVQLGRPSSGMISHDEYRSNLAGVAPAP